MSKSCMVTQINTLKHNLQVGKAIRGKKKRKKKRKIIRWICKIKRKEKNWMVDFVIINCYFNDSYSGILQLKNSMRATWSTHTYCMHDMIW